MVVESAAPRGGRVDLAVGSHETCPGSEDRVSPGIPS